MPSEIIQLRQALYDAEAAYERRQQLCNVRNSLETSILSLRHEIDRDFQRLYKKNSTHSSDLLPWEEDCKEKKKRLQQLEQSLRQIDHELDQTEELTEEAIEQQRANLLYTLWEAETANRAEQESKWNELQQMNKLEPLLEGTLLAMEKINKHLQLAIHTRQKIKGRGLLHYIFGHSPNKIIERQLLETHETIRASLPFLKDAANQFTGTPQEILFLQIHHTLEQLLAPCRMPWGFHHIDTVFTDACNSTELLLEKTRAALMEVKSIKLLINRELNNYIQEFRLDFE